MYNDINFENESFISIKRGISHVPLMNHLNEQLYSITKSTLNATAGISALGIRHRYRFRYGNS